MRLVAPETITFTQSGFCPGCGHGLAVRYGRNGLKRTAFSDCRRSLRFIKY